MTDQTNRSKENEHVSPAFNPDYLKCRPQPKTIDELLNQELKVRELRNSLYIIDLHCHPTLQMYMLNAKIWKRHPDLHPFADIVPCGMRVDLPGMKKGNVTVAFCHHYIPEGGFLHLPGNESLVKLLKLLEKIIRRPLISLFEDDSKQDDAHAKALLSIEKLDAQIKKSADEKGFKVTVAKSFKEYDAAVNAGKTAIIHALEGAHHLGRKLDWEKCEKRLKDFKERGVAMLTLSHFFPNEICDTQGGIPPSIAHKIHYSKKVANCIYMPDPTDPHCNPPTGLTTIGKQLIQWCQDNGMIICLVHSTPETRKQVLDIVQSRPFNEQHPVILSHSGLREVAAQNMTIKDDLEYLPTLDELKRIRDCKGVMGLILMNYWTYGVEEHDPLNVQKGIQYIIDTICYIQQNDDKPSGKLSLMDCLAIGTDLDGFSQEPDDVTHIRRIGNLRRGILNAFGLEIAEKILHCNAERVMTDSWFSVP